MRAAPDVRLPPPPREQMRNLAALAGVSLDPRAEPSPYTLVSLIAQAQAGGATWAQIAKTAGAPDGKTAKRWAKTLAGQATRNLIASEARMGRAAARAERRLKEMLG